MNPAYSKNESVPTKGRKVLPRAALTMLAAKKARVRFSKTQLSQHLGSMAPCSLRSGVRFPCAASQDR